MTNKFKADASLMLITLGWGISFLLTRNTLDSLDVFNFLGIRFTLAFILSFAVFYRKMLKTTVPMLISGFLVGMLLFSSYAFQTVGLLYTSLSNSAFLTGSSVVMVPLIAAIFMKEKPRKEIYVGAVFAFLGIGLLTVTGFDSFNVGDLLTLICALLFALYILAVAKYSKTHEPVAFAIWQIGTVGFVSLLASFIFENPTFSMPLEAWGNILFLAIICTSGAFIVQNVAQKYTTPSHTALIYANEPVFAAIFGYLLAGETMTAKGIFGAALIIVGVLLSELDIKTIFRKETNRKNDRYA